MALQAHDPGSDAGQTYQIENETDRTVRDIALDGNAEHVLDTSGLNGSYRVANESSVAFNFTDGIASSDPATSAAEAAAAAFEVREQSLAMDPDAEAYTYGEYGRFDVTSNRGDFVVNVSANGLNATELAAVFGGTDESGDQLNLGPFSRIRGSGGERLSDDDSIVVYPDADVVAVYAERGGSVTANYSADVFDTADNHTFQFDVQDSTANDSATVEVTEEQVGDGTSIPGVGNRSELTVDTVSFAVNGTNNGHRSLDSLPSDGTAAIVVGTNNETVGEPLPVPDRTVEVRIERPDGQVDTVSVTTGADGSAVVDYDLTGKPNGTYRVEAADHTSSSVQFDVGPVARIVPEGQYLSVGERTNFTLHAAENGRPVDVERAIVVERFGSNGWTTVENTTVNTGTDGFATVPFTPSENGEYRVRVPNVESANGLYAEAGVARARLQMHEGYNGYRAEVPSGSAVAIGATVVGADGPVANTNLTVTIFNRSDYTAEENLSVRTNDNGQFATTWQAPDAPLGTNYRVRISGESVGTIATEYNLITLRDTVPESESGDSGSDGGTTGSPNVYSQDHSGTVTPGGSASYDVNVEDAEGVGVPNARVFYALQLGYDGATVATGTVETDASGYANVTAAVPDWVPYGTNLRLRTVAQVNGTVVTDSEYDQRFTRYKVDGEFYDSTGQLWGDVAPGERFRYNMTVRDAATGEPVSDIPVGLVLESRDIATGSDSLNASLVRTDANGVATYTARAPTGFAGRIQVNSIALPKTRGEFRFVNAETVKNYSVDLTDGQFSQEVEAGSTFSFNISTRGTTQPVTAVVTAGTTDDYDTNETRLGDDTALYSAVVQEGDTVRIPVPSNVDDGQRFRVNVLTTTPSGPQGDEIGVIDQYFTVNSSTIDDSSPPAAAATLPDRVSVNNTFVVDASAAADDTGIDTYEVTTETGTTVTSPTPEITVPGFNRTGTYNVTVTVTDGFGKTDTVTRTVEVVTAADVVGDLSVADEQPYRTDQTATVTVSNDGSRVIDGAIAVNVTTDRSDVPAFTRTFDVGGLNASESVNETVDFTSWVRANNVTGDVTVSLGVVSPDDVTEATLFNNNATETTTVTYADLNTSVYVSGGTYENSNATVYAFVRNRGTAASAPVNGTFAVGDDTVALDVPALEPGAVYRTSIERTLTGDTDVSVAVSGDERFPAGNRTERTIAVEPFDLTMNYVTDERRVEAGTEFYLSTSFEATSETDATLDIDLPDGLSLVRGSTTRTEHVYAGTNWESWRIEAEKPSDGPYEVNVTVSANGANATGAGTVTVTVPTVRVRNSSQSVISTGESDTGTVEVVDAETFDHSLTIDVQAGNAGRSLKGLDYLVHYPYGCVEQTASPMLSGLYVDQYYRNASVSYDRATVNGTVLAGVDRLAPGGVDTANAQHDTGAWSMWGNSPSGDMFYTAYAAFGTASVANDPIQGDRSAVERNVSRIDYSAAVDWLRAEQNADGSFRHQHYLDDREAMTGFILVGLRKADRVGLNESASQDLTAIRSDAADYLLTQQQSDGSWGSAQSTALAVWGLQTALESGDVNETEVRAAIDDGRSWLVNNQQDDGAWERYHRSYAWDATGDRSESTAYALLALNATGVSNDNETVRSGVSYLAGVYEEDGSWGYTRATALAIRALTVTGGTDAAERTVTVTIGADSMNDPISKDIAVTPGEPITQVELTDDELERLRSAGDSSTRSVEVSTGSDAGGRVYVEVLNDQVVNETQYDG